VAWSALLSKHECNERQWRSVGKRLECKSSGFTFILTLFTRTVHLRTDVFYQTDQVSSRPTFTSLVFRWSASSTRPHAVQLKLSTMATSYELYYHSKEAAYHNHYNKRLPSRMHSWRVSSRPSAFMPIYIDLKTPDQRKPQLLVKLTCNRTATKQNSYKLT